MIDICDGCEKLPDCRNYLCLKNTDAVFGKRLHIENAAMRMNKVRFKVNRNLMSWWNPQIVIWSHVAGVRPAVPKSRTDTRSKYRSFLLKASDNGSIGNSFKDIYAGDVTGLFESFIKCHEIGHLPLLCHVRNQPRWSLQKAMNFMVWPDFRTRYRRRGDVVLEQEDSHNYKRAIYEMEN